LRNPKTQIHIFLKSTRRWYGAKDEDSLRHNFRGLIVSEEKYFLCDMVTIDAPTIVYAIDGHKMELETSYQEYVSHILLIPLVESKRLTFNRSTESYTV